jgi:hypothetical protein
MEQEKIVIGGQPQSNEPTKNPSYKDLKTMDLAPEDINSMLVGLKNKDITKEEAKLFLTNLNIPEAEANRYVDGIYKTPEATPITSTQPVLSVEPKEDKKQVYGEMPVGDFFKAITDTVELPSKGVFYKNQKSSVTFKHLTASEDDILFSQEIIEKNRQVDALLEACILDKDIRPSEMLTGDRNYVIVQIRRSGFGDTYRPDPLACNSCGNIFTEDIDLSKLNTKELTIMPDADGLYSLTTPMRKMNIRIRLLNGQDENEINSIATAAIRNQGQYKVNTFLTQTYLRHIMEVNGQKDKIYIKSFVETMPTKDAKFLRDFLVKVNPGLELTYDFTCPECKEKQNRRFNINTSFLYPE